MRERENLRIEISPHGIARVLASVIVVLSLVGVGSQAFRIVTGHEFVYGLIPLLNLGGERNVGTFFTTSMLLLAAVLLGIIATLTHKVNGDYTSRWVMLSLGFVYLAMDEASSIHELFIRPTRELLGEAATGVLYWPWVIPGIVAVTLVGSFFIGFLIHLTTRTRSLFLIAGAFYVGGSIGVEMVEANYMSLWGKGTLTYVLICSVEETMEMAGIAIFIFAILDYLATEFGDFQVAIGMKTGARD